MLRAVCHVPSSRDPGSAHWAKPSSNGYTCNCKEQGIVSKKAECFNKARVGRCAGITSRKQQPFWLECCRAGASRTRGPEIPTVTLGEAAFHCLQRACGGISVARLQSFFVETLQSIPTSFVCSKILGPLKINKPQRSHVSVRYVY